MDDLFVARGVVIAGRDLSWTAVRASGPGGQNVNKVASKVDLRFDLARSDALTEAQKARLRALAGARLDAAGRLRIVAQAARDQPRNLEAARAALAALVRRALVPPKPRKKTRPSRGARERRLGQKHHVAEKKRARRRPDE